MPSENIQNKDAAQKARLIIALNALYSIADSLCSVFVSVYFYVNSLDINTVLIHYLTLYIVTPVVFTLAGWYAKSRDRTHVFRIGLVLHAAYYASLLYLREDAPQYAMHLGALLGVTWGFFWAGNNTFQFDFSSGMRSREYFLGMISTVSSGAHLIAPLFSGLLISLAPEKHTGYQIIFSVALVLYVIASVLSFRIPHSEKGKPFRFFRALFPQGNTVTGGLSCWRRRRWQVPFTSFIFCLPSLCIPRRAAKRKWGDMCLCRGWPVLPPHL